jgi:hypothetical protein
VTEANAVTDVALISDHEGEGVALLPGQLRKANVEGFTRGLMTSVQRLETATHPLVVLGIDESSGHALTQLGELMGLRRLDATTITDARYRVALHAWARTMRSNGTLPDVDAVMSILTGEELNSGAWAVTEVFPAAMLAEPTDALLTDDGYVGAIARRLRAGGVELQVICPPAGNAFRFAAGSEALEAGTNTGFADLSGSTPVDGGELAGVVH